MRNKFTPLKSGVPRQDMEKFHKGIVFFVVGLLEISIFLIGIIAVPFPQLLDNTLMDIQGEDLQNEFDELMADDQSFRDQVLEQLQSSFYESLNQNEMENRNDENYFEFITQDDSVGPFEIPNRDESAMDVPESGTDMIVTVAECHAGVLQTEKGSITFVDGVFPHVLPLCWDENTTEGWYLDFDVYGGYEPYDFGSYMTLTQIKNDIHRVWFVDIVWEEMDQNPLCCYTTYRATFVVKDPICLESSQYPEVPATHPYFELCGAQGCFIPGKQVIVNMYLDWAGCYMQNQHFKLIPLRDKYQFS